MNILFDLDGTLTDSKEGIIKSLAFALESLNMPVPADLQWCVGPPLHDNFRKILGEEGRVHEAVSLYRQRYGKIGIFENSVYDGILEMLDSAREKGATLYVATSKPKFYADQIIDHFGLRSFFKEVHGSELNGVRNDKAELIAYILATHGLPAESCLMVGDREHDMIGAFKNKIPGIGAAWGYGSHDELTRAGARHVVAKPSDVIALI